jgi:hypothetical protein
MIALLRYQAAILLRSPRWIFPLIAYGVLVAAGAAEGGTPLAGGLAWSAAMLVPVVAFLTRSMLTAEPDAARACVAAAAGPVRAQLAALLTALAGGTVLAAGGACLMVLTSDPAATTASHPSVAGKITASFTHPDVFLADLATAGVCLLVASAVGALLNPPLLRHPGIAVLSTLAAVIFALVSGVSPAGAALRHSGMSTTAQWPSLATLVAAACLLAIAWTLSALAAARRDTRSLSSS